jgi:hypothetical protein
MESAESLFEEIGRAGLLLSNDWLIRQNNELDKKTNHIYKCRWLKELEEFARRLNLTSDESAYALHRWRNFKRHDAWQSLLFEQVPSIRLELDPFNKKQDFFILTDSGDIPFDLKVTRFPKAITEDISDAELANWFYQNQSTQGRFHLANRFFVVGEPEDALYDIELARRTISGFATDMKKYRHFIKHPNGNVSRAVLLRQHANH